MDKSNLSKFLRGFDCMLNACAFNHCLICEKRAMVKFRSDEIVTGRKLRLMQKIKIVGS